MYNINKISKVLLISPEFFNYSQIIKRALEEKGFIVDWYSDRNGVSFFKKAILRVKKSLANNSIKKYLDKILKETSATAYDYVFVINGEVITANFIEKMRRNQPQAKFVLYMWDALANFKDSELIAPLFDDCYSFDISDCTKNKLFKFLPLFYYNKNAKEDFAKSEKIYDYACIATVKPGKIQYLNRIFSQLDSKFSASYKYLFLQSRLVYFYYKLKYKEEFKGTKMSSFKYKRLSPEKCECITRQSRFIVDIPMKNQNGLTIRTFETLSRGQKLLTSNTNITQYDFYSKEIIYLYSKGEIDFKSDFFKKDVVETSVVFEKYFIGEWLNRILGLENK